MQVDFESSQTWLKSLGVSNNHSASLLRESYLGSRKKIEALLQNIEKDIKGLTVHDISHIDSLWQVSDEIIGDKNYLNPAEGYVLGCAFLIHDAAHVSPAYSGGLASLTNTDEWKDLVGLKFKGSEPIEGSAEYESLLFDVARIHHAKQAKEITRISWRDQSNNTEIYFIDEPELRSIYSELIGEIAESHNWSSEKVFNTFQHRKINPPGFLNEKDWEVDCLKIAFILRTADAAHIDSRRAPSYLFSFLNPQKTSRLHWLYQNKLGKLKLIDNKLRINSGSSFNETERSAWWLAFDTAQMIDKELKSAFYYLCDGGREPLSAQSVLGIESPSSFSSYVTVNNWEPEDTSIYISNLPSLIKMLGGSALYGNDETVSFRELIQNSVDSINAALALGYLNEGEGKIKVIISDGGEDNLKFTIVDNGLGMSKYVLKNVLLDFGSSLWGSSDVISEYPTLLQNNFSSIGKFGIGFYSVFMVSDSVEIITRRYEKGNDETSDSWKLTFEDGLNERPFISIPRREESLKRHGTKISFIMKKDLFLSIVRKEKISLFLEGDEEALNKLDGELYNLNRILAYLFPASEITIETECNKEKGIAVSAQDWLNIDCKELLDRRFLTPTSIWSSGLFPIYDNGNVVGRFLIEPFGYYMSNINCAIVCHRGVRSGKIYGLSGICLTSKNNERAVRMDGLPNYPIASWIEWAKLVTGEKPRLPENCLLRLHPLIPENDLMVWHLNDERCYLKDIISHLESKIEMLIHDGGIYYSVDDEVPEGAFDEDFTQKENIIISPRNIDISSSKDDRIIDFISTLYNKPIDYIKLIKDSINNSFECVRFTSEIRAVGQVDDTEIMRNVIVVNFGK